MRRARLIVAMAVALAISMPWPSSAGAQLLNFEGAWVSSAGVGTQLQLFATLFTGIPADDNRPPVQLTNDGTNVTPSFSQSGSQVLFASTRSDGVQIWRMQADGTNQTQLTTQPGGAAEPSPFPSTGAVNTFVGSFAVGFDTEICMFDLGSGATTQLTNNGTGDNSPDVSSNGQSIVWQQGAPGPSEIWIMNSDGTGQTQLTNNAVTDSRPRFTPDGQTVVFSQGTPPNANIMSHDLTTGTTTELTSGNTDSNPVPYQGGIAFVRQTDAGGRLYAMGPAGETPGPLNGADQAVSAAGGMDLSQGAPSLDVIIERLKLTKRDDLKVHVFATEPVQVFMESFFFRLGNQRGAGISKRKKVKFKPETVDLTANESTVVTLDAAKKAETALGSAADDGKKVKVTVTVTEVGGDGGSVTEKDKVKPK